MKVKIKDFIIAAVLILYGAMFFLNIMAISFNFAERDRLKLEIQKKDVTIDALILSCDMDYLIKNLRGENENN